MKSPHRYQTPQKLTVDKNNFPSMKTSPHISPKYSIHECSDLSYSFQPSRCLPSFPLYSPLLVSQHPTLSTLFSRDLPHRATSLLKNAPPQSFFRVEKEEDKRPFPTLYTTIDLSTKKKKNPLSLSHASHSEEDKTTTTHVISVSLCRGRRENTKGPSCSTRSCSMGRKHGGECTATELIKSFNAKWHGEEGNAYKSQPWVKGSLSTSHYRRSGKNLEGKRESRGNSEDMRKVLTRLRGRSAEGRREGHSEGWSRKDIQAGKGETKRDISFDRSLNSSRISGRSDSRSKVSRPSASGQYGELSPHLFNASLRSSQEQRLMASRGERETHLGMKNRWNSPSALMPTASQDPRQGNGEEKGDRDSKARAERPQGEVRESIKRRAEREKQVIEEIQMELEGRLLKGKSLRNDGSVLSAMREIQEIRKEIQSKRLERRNERSPSLSDVLWTQERSSEKNGEEQPGESRNTVERGRGRTEKELEERGLQGEEALKEPEEGERSGGGKKRAERVVSGDSELSNVSTMRQLENFMEQLSSVDDNGSEGRQNASMKLRESRKHGKKEDESAQEYGGVELRGLVCARAIALSGKREEEKIVLEGKAKGRNEREEEHEIWSVSLSHVSDEESSVIGIKDSPTKVDVSPPRVDIEKLERAVGPSEGTRSAGQSLERATSFVAKELTAEVGKGDERKRQTEGSVEAKKDNKETKKESLGEGRLKFRQGESQLSPLVATNPQSGDGCLYVRHNNTFYPLSPISSLPNSLVHPVDLKHYPPSTTVASPAPPLHVSPSSPLSFASPLSPISPTSAHSGGSSLQAVPPTSASYYLSPATTASVSGVPLASASYSHPLSQVPLAPKITERVVPPLPLAAQYLVPSSFQAPVSDKRDTGSLGKTLRAEETKVEEGKSKEERDLTGDRKERTSFLDSLVEGVASFFSKESKSEQETHERVLHSAHLLPGIATVERTSQRYVQKGLEKREWEKGFSPSLMSPSSPLSPLSANFPSSPVSPLSLHEGTYNRRSAAPERLSSDLQGETLDEHQRRQERKTRLTGERKSRESLSHPLEKEERVSVVSPSENVVVLRTFARASENDTSNSSFSSQPSNTDVRGEKAGERGTPPRESKSLLDGRIVRVSDARQNWMGRIRKMPGGQEAVSIANTPIIEEEDFAAEAAENNNTGRSSARSRSPQRNRSIQEKETEKDASVTERVSRMTHSIRGSVPGSPERMGRQTREASLKEGSEAGDDVVHPSTRSIRLSRCEERTYQERKSKSLSSPKAGKDGSISLLLTPSKIEIETNLFDANSSTVVVVETQHRPSLQRSKRAFSHQ